MMHKTSWAALAISGLLGIGWWSLRIEGPRRNTPLPAEHELAQAAPLSSTSVEVDDPRASSLGGAEELEAYLVTLESDARERGAVLPGDMRRGARAIDALSASIGADQAYVKKRLFGERMARLRQYLDLQPVRSELDRIAERIETEPDRSERARWVTRYQATSAKLTGLHRLEALERLKRIAD